jgi:hypothetical protein
MDGQTRRGATQSVTEARAQIVGALGAMRAHGVAPVTCIGLLVDALAHCGQGPETFADAVDNYLTNLRFNVN